MDLAKESGIFQKKVGSFHQSVLEKKIKIGNWVESYCREEIYHVCSLQEAQNNVFREID